MKDSLSVLGRAPVARIPGALERPGAETYADGPPGDPASGAEEFWKRMTLSAAPAEVSSPPRIPVPAELRSVLSLFETAVRGSVTGEPSAPSAGALYPYEHYAAVPHPQGAAVYAVDPVQRRCRLLRAGPQVVHALEQSGLDAPREQTSVVLSVVRPWLSMRKYGDRGYLYAQLDTAHLATHLLCLASENFAGAELRTRLISTSLSLLLDFGGNCRFVHSALVLQGGTTADGAGADGGPDSGGAATDVAQTWRCVDDRMGAPLGRAACWPETECWQTLTEYRPRSAVSPAVPAAPAALFPGVQESARRQAFPRRSSLTELAARRRSTKDFGAAALPGDALEHTLAALGTPLTTDLPEVTGLGATLVVRRVEGMAPGCYPIHGDGLADACAAAPDGDELVRLCMGQEHLRHTGAVVLFHAPRGELFRHGARGVDDALLRAGALAHLLYLGSTEAGSAITTIGGFDAGRWGRLAALPKGHEVVYVAMLGMPGESTVKLDRLNRAYAHNER
ncbi:nitroreductase family protein [Streptomyces albidus (ex Kaewkla and Franco 2022)]|uniref:nitroreductase family protein n=1 Tax=Streptomyces albidus (ex Kaewkla and Franco 2022) TaxID=722709 RepID=UPI0015EEFFE6|nr:hypothetical protein [Streptomyces albidus (ex Kaewkla and Franco 2022)]